MDAAMSAAVSGLKAQSQALGTISNNLANSQTSGYKAVLTQYLTQLTGAGAQNYYPSGGVRAISTQNLSDSGLISSTTTTTNMAIDGDGLFAVQYGLTSATNNYTDVYYTRNGNFKSDAEGNLQLTGTNYYLMGWPTDVNGNVTAANKDNIASLSVVNINQFNSSAVASSNYTFQANLPAEATAGYTETTSMQIYDSLGVAQVFPVTWTKSSTTANEWTMSVGSPTNPAGTTQTGDLLDSGGATVTSNDYTVTFNSDGTLGSVVAVGTAPLGGTATNPMPLLSASFSGAAYDGAADASVAVSLGTIGKTDGLSQYNTGETKPSIQVKNNYSDGVQYGQLTGVSVDEDGFVVAAYSNGNKTKIYKIPVVTFNNEDGLSAKTNGVYEQTSYSGNYVLNSAGTNSSGAIVGQALEGSNVDTSTEFSNMITCQQAYSAASQVIGTDKQMFQSLLSQMQ